MKTWISVHWRGLGIAALVVAAVVGVGCSSTPKADWNSRIGGYTYDEAVREMGPPERSSTLSDGSQVAEWFVRSSPSTSFGVGTGFYRAGGGVAVGQSVGSAPRGQYLRLTFGPEGKLTRWERIQR